MWTVAEELPIGSNIFAAELVPDPASPGEINGFFLELEFEDDGSLLFRARVSGLNEIVWWILGYGDQAEVMQPAKLRRLVAKRAKNMAAIYNGDGK